MKTMKKTLPIFALFLTLASCNGTATSSENKTDTGSQKINEKSDFDTTKKIICYTRDTTSGTRDGFFTKIGMGEAKTDNSKLVKGFVEVASNGDMVNRIKADEYGIGYISLSTLKGSNLNGLTFNNVIPNEENVLNESYQLTRNFNYVKRVDYADDDKVGKIVDAFIAYMQTSDAKAIIKENDGILKITATDKKWADIKGNYPIVNENNSNVTVKFGGSTSVEKIAKKLTAAFSPLCGNFIADHNHTGSGDAFKHTQAENTKDDAAGKLDVGFLSRELESNEPAAEGSYGKICTDAIVAVVNEKNPYKSTDGNTLMDIYKGTKTLWNQIIA